MEFRAMTQADLDYLSEHSISRGIAKKLPDEVEWSYALEHEGVTLGIGGIRLINSTTAWGWLDLSDKAGENIYTVYRVIKEWMEKLCKEKGIKRLQAYTEIGFRDAETLIKHLGFHDESVMFDFIGDLPARMWAQFF